MKLNSSQKKALSLLLIVFCFLFPHYSGFPIFIYPVIILLVIWLFLKYIFRENLSDLFSVLNDLN